MCETCWFAERGLVLPPLLVRPPVVKIEFCCFCGDPTIAGIGLRVQQSAVTRSFCAKNRELVAARR